MSNFDSLFTEQEKQTKKYGFVKQLLENSYNRIKSFNPSFTIEEATTYASSSFGTDYSTNGLYHKFALGLTKRSFDRLIAPELVGVQPMSGPIGLYYALRYYADDTYDSGSNIELGYNRIDSTYSGSYSSSASEVLGSNVTGDDGLGIGTGVQMNDISIKLEKKQVEAKSRKLRARLTDELIQDVSNMHNRNIQNELYDGIAREISTEIDYEIINKIESVATSGSNVDFSAIAGNSKSELCHSFISNVITEANRIGTNTNHGVGNYVICSPNISTALESTSNFSISTLKDMEYEKFSKIYHAGKINNMHVYRNIFWNTDKFIVGYKGETELDAGLFYLPYIFTTLESSGETTFQPNISILSRYAIGESIFGASNYYRKIDVINYV